MIKESVGVWTKKLVGILWVSLQLQPWVHFATATKTRPSQPSGRSALAHLGWRKETMGTLQTNCPLAFERLGEQIFQGKVETGQAA